MPPRSKKANKPAFGDLRLLLAKKADDVLVAAFGDPDTAVLEPVTASVTETPVSAATPQRKFGDLRHMLKLKTAATSSTAADQDPMLASPRAVSSSANPSTELSCAYDVAATAADFAAMPTATADAMEVTIEMSCPETDESTEAAVAASDAIAFESPAAARRDLDEQRPGRAAVEATAGHPTKSSSEDRPRASQEDTAQEQGPSRRRARRKIAQESESEEGQAPATCQDSESDDVVAAPRASRRKVTIESDDEGDGCVMKQRRQKILSAPRKQSAPEQPVTLERPANGTWQITLEGANVAWGEARLKEERSYLQQGGSRTPLEILGDGSESSPYRLGAAVLVGSSEGQCEWQWPDGRKSHWVQLSTPPRKKRRRREIASDASQEGEFCEQLEKESSKKKKHRKSRRKDKRSRKSLKKPKTIMEDSWERWLAMTRPKSPSPPRLPLGPLADSDGEASVDEADADRADGSSCSNYSYSSESSSAIRRARKRKKAALKAENMDAADKKSKSSKKAKDIDYFAATSCTRNLLRNR